jgi:hypothetical protein
MHVASASFAKYLYRAPFGILIPQAHPKNHAPFVKLLRDVFGAAVDDCPC